jgi:hypothetical protein
LICLEVEFEEVIPSIGAIVSTEDVKVVVNCNRSVEGPWTWWMILVVLLVLK